jgi:hypothetical protein
MGMLQTLLAMSVLIYVLRVIVQAVQEGFKRTYSSKDKTIVKTFDEFMGNILPVDKIRVALRQRGLDLPALENFNKEDFRHLLDAIPGLDLNNVVADAQVTFEQKKDNIAAAFEAAQAKFQASYTKHNKMWVRIISALVVLALNANLIFLYQELVADQAMSQTIAATADKLVHTQAKDAAGTSSGGQTEIRGQTEIQGGANVQAHQKQPKAPQSDLGVGQQQQKSPAGTGTTAPSQDSNAAARQQGKKNSKQEGKCVPQDSSSSKEPTPGLHWYTGLREGTREQVSSPREVVVRQEQKMARQLGSPVVC